MLDNLRYRENELLKKYDIKHPPTIGSMYEGLTKEILSRAIPNNLHLHVRSGVIVNEQGKQSRQIDCMLVRGEGERIPYTDDYKYRVRNVLAVIEVKKNLFTSDLESGYQNLLSVTHLVTPYAFDLAKSRLLRHAFESTTQIQLPGFEKEKIQTLPFHIQLIYAVLLAEITRPLRIIFGYNGFSSELHLRDAFFKYLESNLYRKGFGPGNFPNLIVCDQYSLIKLNGMPYSSPVKGDYWLFYGSYAFNPLLVLTELIWTRLSYFYEISPDMFGDDLTVEVFHPFISGKALEKGDQTGWDYMPIYLSNDELKSTAAFTQWSPCFLNEAQCVVMTRLCKEAFIDITDRDFVEFVESSGYKLNEFIESLLATHLAGLRDNRLSLVTDECTCMVLPDGSYVAAENRSGRLSRWVTRFMESWQPKGE